MGTLVFILLFISVFPLLFFFGRKKEIPFKYLAFGWLVKLTGIFFYAWVFSTYYGQGNEVLGDSYNFFEDSKVLNQYAKEDFGDYLKIIAGISGDEIYLSAGPLEKTNIWDAAENGEWINDNRLIIRINSIIHFFSFQNYFVHALIMSMLSFSGMILCFLAFRDKVANKWLFLIALFITPSLLFWGSGLTKEALFLFGAGVFFISLKNLEAKKFVKGIFLLILGIFLLIFNKPYAGLILIGVSFVFVLGRLLVFKNYGLILFSLGIILTFIVFSFTPEKINLVDRISYKQRDVSNLGKGGIFFITDSSFCAFDHKYLSRFDTLGNYIKVNKTTEGEYKLFGKDTFYPFSIQPSENLYEVYLILAPSSSYFNSTKIDDKGVNLVKTIPEVLINTMVRPFPWDNGTKLKIIAFIQNIVFLALLIFSFLHRKVITDQTKYLIYFLIVSSILILLIIGWTTPVFGAIVRYKVPVDLLLLIASFIMLSPIQIKIRK